MTDVRRAYSSTVVATGHLTAAAVTAAALLSYGIAFLPAGAVAGPASGAVVIVLAGVQMTTVRLMVSPEYVRVGQGPWGWPQRVIPAPAIRAAHAQRFSFLQAFGIGVRFYWKTTRLTVRPGPALELILADGECVRVSTPDPIAAALLITGRESTEAATADRSAEGKGEQHA